LWGAISERKRFTKEEFREPGDGGEKTPNKMTPLEDHV